MNNVFLQSILEKVQICLSRYGESASVQFVEETEDEVRAAVGSCSFTSPKV